VIVQRKKNGKTVYCVITHEAGRNMGCYPTRAKAQQRLNTIKRFRKK